MTDGKPAGKASIIIVSYNGWGETTQPCLESVFAHTDYADFEVVVVDNNSTDGTREGLASLAAREPRLTCILNPDNRGFARGNNDGIDAATGDYLVLLNSDTRVTNGWLPKLLTPLARDRGIGLVGPVSNAAGNEQEIFTRDRDVAGIIREGENWAEAAGEDVVPVERLSFFCVATRRDVVSSVGSLDPRYGIGFYEDDDYCLRVRNAGLDLACCEGVFVYHRGSASFGTLPGSEVKRLMRENRKSLQEKFGLWRYRPAHPRQRHLELVELYLETLRQRHPDRRLAYRIRNRLNQLGRLTPRGFFKRMLFEVQMRRLESAFHTLLAKGR